MKNLNIEKIAGGVLIASTLVDGVSMVLSGNRIQDYIPSEIISGIYHGFTQVGPATALGAMYFIGSD